MFLYIKTNILRGYGIFKNDFAHTREPATILASFTVMGPLIWYVNAQVRMWIILDINYKHYYHLGKSQICAGAGDYFRTSKPHSEKLWHRI